MLEKEFSDTTSIRFGIYGDSLFSDRCVWCLQNDKLSNSHWFPQRLGSRFSTKTSCIRCNSSLGLVAEAFADQNAFLTAAIVKLGLDTKKGAFRKAKKVDVQTGIEMHFTDDGHSKPVPKLLPDGKFVGSQADLERYWTKWFEVNRPNWPVGPVIEFLRDPKRSIFSYGCVTISHKRIEGGPTEGRLERLTKDVYPPLVFKLVYEFLALNGLLDSEWVRDKVNSLFKVTTGPIRNVITFEDEVAHRIVTNHHNFEEYRQLESIDFKPYHSATLRLSARDTLYVDVAFFGVLHSLFLLGTVESYASWLYGLVGNCLICPIGEEERGAIEPYQNLRNRNFIQWADIMMDIRLSELKGAVG